ncbi:hypothetical protein EYC59_04115 [Candidatus Saccharibacteria bacterium]|nr:MAG: hypothetical protein EYC59_04115 [Candidatus Saccharibacteria bacterium]
MDPQDPPEPDVSEERRLRHGMPSITPVHEVAPEEIAREKRTTPDIYPEVVRHLPGNSEKESLPTLTGAQPLPLEVANRRVRERIQSLEPYAITATGYSLLNVYLYTAAHKILAEGTALVGVPGTLQYIALGAAIIVLASTLPLFLSRKLSAVKVALLTQQICYAVVFAAAFVFMVLNVAYFFFGVGLLAFTTACFFLWSRYARKDIESLPDYDNR